LRSAIAALDASTGAATSWDPSAAGPAFVEVAAIAVSKGTVYVGGDFTEIGGQPRNHIAALDPASGAATSWDPNADGTEVYALAVSGNTIYAGGFFDHIGGKGRQSIAALDAATGAATSWDPDADGTVLALSVKGNTVFAGGVFDHIGGQQRARIAALDAKSGAASTWDAQVSELSHGVAAIEVSGSTVYVGGEFRDIAGQPQASIAAVSAQGHDPAPVSQEWSATGSVDDALTVGQNPVRAGTEFRYSVPQEGRVRLELLDVSGRIVRTLADQSQPAGRYAVAWDGTARGGRLSPGLYFVRLTTPDRVTMSKFAVIP